MPEDFIILPIGEAFNDQVLGIMEATPIQANGLSLRFDKSPDFLALSRIKYSECHHLGFFLGDTLKGVASLGFYDALIDGVEETVFTLYNFYILPEARGNHLSARATREFISIARKKARFGIAVTLKGNRPAESYIGRVDNQVPPSRIIDDLCIKSILMAFPKKNTTGLNVRNAVSDDIPDIVKILNYEHCQRFLGLVFQEEKFIANLKIKGVEISDYYVATDRQGRIKGACLAWDCSCFRRTRVMKISPRFYPLLCSYRIMEKAFTMAPFPEPGEHFNELTITDYAVENRDAKIMNALLCEIYHRNLNGKYHLMNFGSCTGDNLLRAVKGFWHFNTVSGIIFTSLDPAEFNIKTRLPYIDIAFL